MSGGVSWTDNKTKTTQAFRKCCTNPDKGKSESSKISRQNNKQYSTNVKRTHRNQLYEEKQQDSDNFLTIRKYHHAEFSVRTIILSWNNLLGKHYFLYYHLYIYLKCILLLSSMYNSVIKHRFTFLKKNLFMKSLLCVIIINFNLKFCLNRVSIYPISATYPSLFHYKQYSFRCCCWDGIKHNKCHTL